jgi:geranylgeranyl pyrophosphate synthase
MDFAAEFKHRIARVEAGLERLVPPVTTRPSRLHAAMRYSLLGGGKRLRPVLTLTAAELCGARGDAALPAAVALECVHTYSLIHDDLPCMDNDDLRRGRPTAHKQFDEATALLAGDALLTEAFVILAENYAAQPSLSHALIRELANAASSQRLIGGQMEDLLAEHKANATSDELEFIHLNKTAAMIEAALVMGGIVGLAARPPAVASMEMRPGAVALPPEVLALRTIGRHLGLAFQITDDVLDATADTATLGKTAGKDARAGKTTFVSLHGLDASRRLAREHTDAALAAVAALPGDKIFLTTLIETMAGRAS